MSRDRERITIKKSNWDRKYPKFFPAVREDKGFEEILVKMIWKDGSECLIMVDRLVPDYESLEYGFQINVYIDPRFVDIVRFHLGNIKLL